MDQQPDEKSYIFRPEYGKVTDIARLNEQYGHFVAVYKLFHPAFKLQGDETIVDLGCGSGDWCIEVGFHHDALNIIGLDIDEEAVKHAMLHARMEHVENATFEVCDIMKERLPFQDESVDYVNIVLANSFLPKEQWPRVLAECTRILRSGGWVRSVEWIGTQSNSTALHKLGRIFGQAFEQGRLYIEFAPMIRPLLEEAGLQPVPLQVHAVDFSFDTPAHRTLAENSYHALILAQPFILSQGIVTQQEYEALIEDMQRDTMLPKFYAMSLLSDIAAQKPPV